MLINKSYSCQINQDGIGLLCDDFEHIKAKGNKSEVDDLGKIRCIKISPHPSLSQILCGDSCGYIWTFNPIDMKLINIDEVHENEILDIDFAPYDEFYKNRSLLVASSSKDHTVKLFNPKDNLKELRHIEDHKWAVVGVKFIKDNYDCDLKIVSADTKGEISTRSIDDDLNLTLPTKRELKNSKIYSMVSSDNNLLLGMDRKIQIGTLRANNTLILK